MIGNRLYWIGRSNVSIKKIAEDVKREAKKELTYYDEDIGAFLRVDDTLAKGLDKLILDENIKNKCQYTKGVCKIKNWYLVCSIYLPFKEFIYCFIKP